MVKPNDDDDMPLYAESVPSITSLPLAILSVKPELEQLLPFIRISEIRPIEAYFTIGVTAAVHTVHPP